MFSVNVNSMRLKSAFEDFEGNTLKAVAGVGQTFLRGRLQDGEGGYEHWGLAKVHGAEAAVCAIGSSTGQFCPRF